MKLARWLRARDWRGLGLELAPAVAFAWTFPLRDYMAQDTVVARWYELALVLAVYGLLTAGLVAVLHKLLPRRFARLLAAMLTLYYWLATYYVQGVDWSRRLMQIVPWGGSWIVPAAILLASVAIGWALVWCFEHFWTAGNDTALGLLRVMCAVFFVMNLWLFVRYLAHQQRAAAYQPQNTTGQLSLQTSQPRDIYYFVFDRYASQQSLDNYYQFNNSQFLMALKDQGFNVRDNAYANYQYTAPSIASTLRMDYHLDMSKDLATETAVSSLPYRTIIEDSPVSQDLRAAGYDIINVGSWWEVTRQQRDARNILPKFALTLLGHTWNLSELQTNSLSETFLTPLLQGGFHIGSFQIIQLTTSNQRDLFLDQMKTLKQLAAEPHTKPRFVFVHILNPHPPYVFAADGSLPDYDGADGDSDDISRAQKYTNQMQYDNTQYLAMIADIKAHASTPPIILLQADEGPYPIGYDTNGNLHGAYQWQNVSTDTLKEKLGVFAAYDLPGIAPTEIAKLDSSVNLFRFVFNEYFGANLPYLSDCSVMFNLGNKPFQFYDITSQLHAEASDCKALTGAK